MKQKLQKYYPLVLLGLALCLLLLINLFFQDHWLDSDMAAEMMFSKLLAEEGRIFASPSWCYSTEFRFLYTHLVMGPLFRVLSDWHTIRLLTNLVFYAVLLVSYFYFMKPLKVSRKITVLTSLLLLLPFSETMMLHMQIGNTYLSHVIIMYFFFGMFLRLCGSDGKKRSKKWKILPFYLFLALVCGISGIRYLLALQCPLVLAAFLYCLLSEEFQQFRQTPSREGLSGAIRSKSALYFFYSLVGFAGSMVGYAINMLYISKHYSFQTYETTNFISVYDGVLLERLQNAIGALLMLFGYIPDKSVISLRGLISVIAFVLIGLMVYCTAKTLKRTSGIRFFVVLFLITAFCLNLFAFVFTTSTMVPRYYITIFIFVLPVLGFYFTEEKLVFDKRSAAAILAVCLCFSTGKTVLSEITVDKNAAKRPVAQFLARNGYDFGFATYTNGNIITELTNGQVEIANVWDPENLNYFKWSSPKKYYEEGYHTGNTFLLLTAEEAAAYADAPSVKSGEKIYEDSHYTVLLFDSVEALNACGGQN